MEGLAIFDDTSLQHALKSSDLSTLEIVLSLQNRNNLQIKTSPIISKLDSNVPVIKPTVLRWTTPLAMLPPHINTNMMEPTCQTNHIRRYSSISQEEEHDRKDSGVSFDEPYRKKQRVMSAEHAHPISRVLPDPPSSSSSRNNSITSLHPLDMRRSSASHPVSLPLPTSPYHKLDYIIAPKLPALSSIHSSNPFHSQLAPMQPQQQTFQRSKSVSTSNTGIFICEHATKNGKVCGQTFRRSYDLSRHQSIHLTNRPFCYCDECGKRFTRMDALRRHERVQGHVSKHRSMSMIPLQQKTFIK